ARRTDLSALFDRLEQGLGLQQGSGARGLSRAARRLTNWTADWSSNRDRLDAFARWPAGTVETLLKPENKTQLTQVLTYHVVPGRITASDLTAMINKSGGKAMLKTVEGEDLSFGMKDGAIWVWDAKGDSAKITIKNVLQSNGVIRVIDTVLLRSYPRLSIS